MRVLLTTDLHLTSRPEHAYRLKYLEWLYDVVCNERVDALIICGDLTDAKDCHYGALINAIVGRLEALTERAKVHILYGNHDGPSPDRPFWAFLDYVPEIRYYTRFEITRVSPLGIEGAGIPAWFVPWGGEKELLDAIAMQPDCEPELILMHATVNKARVENGTEMESAMPSSFLPKWWTKVRVFSGDIHVPQVCGDVEYIGTPYHVHYGDGFEPRTLIWDSSTDEVGESQYPDAPRLMTWHASTLPPSEYTESMLEDTRPGDRVKLVVSLDHEVLPQDWQAAVQQTRQQLAARNVELTSALLDRKRTVRTPDAPSARRSDEAIVRTYGANQNLDSEMVETGVEITKENA